jgi:hypothetical protein
MIQQPRTIPKLIRGAIVFLAFYRVVKNDYRDRYEALTGISLKTCPLCRCGTMVVVETFECASNPMTTRQLTRACHAAAHMAEHLASSGAGPPKINATVNLPHPSPPCSVE